MRPVVDRVILQLLNEETFIGADFKIQSDGVCRLNPELARRVAQLAMNYCESLGHLKRACRYQRMRSLLHFRVSTGLNGLKSARFLKRVASFRY